MKLTYRGQSYEANTIQAETVTTDVAVKYRGAEYKIREIVPTRVWSLF